MKKKKWLIVVILILLLINGIFFLVPKFININKIIESKLKQHINDYLNAEFYVGKINATSKFVQFSNLELKEKNDNFSISAEQFYIRFNFWRFVLTGFNFQKSIRTISCFSPQVEYKLSDSESSVPLDLVKIENQLKQFAKISIINGKFKLKSDRKDLSFQEELHNISLTLETTGNESKLEISAQQPTNSGLLTILRKTSNDKENFTKIKLTNFNLPHFETATFGLTNATLNTAIEFASISDAKGFLTLDKLDFNIKKNHFYSDQIRLDIADNSAVFHSGSDLEWKQESLSFSGKITDILSSQPIFDLHFAAKGISLRHLSKKLRGNLHLSGVLQNTISNPILKHKITIPHLNFGNFNLENINYSGIFSKHKIDSVQATFSFRNNGFRLDGFSKINANKFHNSEIYFDLKSTGELSFAKLNLFARTPLIASIRGRFSQPRVNFKIDDLAYQTQLIALEDLNLNGSFKNNELFANLDNKNKTLLLTSKLTNFPQTKLVLSLTTDKLQLNRYLRKQTLFLDKNNPSLTSKIDLSLHNHRLEIDGSLGFPKKTNPVLSGNLKFTSNYYLTKEGKGNLSLTSDSLKIDQTPFQIKILASKKYDTLYLDTLNLNNNLTGKGKLCYKKTHIQKFQNYCGNLNISNVNINSLNKHLGFSPYLQNFEGVVNSQIRLNSKENKIIQGHLEVNSFRPNSKFNKVNSKLDFSVVNDTIFLDKILMYRKDKEILCGNGSYSLNNNKNIFLDCSGKDVSLTKLFPNETFSAKLDYDLLFTGTVSDPRILGNISSGNGKIYKTPYDELNLQFFQNSKNIFVKKLRLNRKNKFNLSLKGNYSYNMLKDEYYEKPDSLYLTAEGDFLDIAADYMGIIEKGKGKTNFNFVINSQNEGITIKSGDLQIHEGLLKISNQPEDIKSFNAQLKIRNNVVENLYLSSQVGLGKLKVHNEINLSDSDLVLGGINFGTLLLETEEPGLLIHVPKYSPEKSMAEAQLMGKDDDYFKIYNKNGFILLQGKVLLSNGKGLYERKKKKKLQEPEIDSYNPLAYDVDLTFGKNAWFVSDPFYLRVDQGDYIRLQIIPELDEYNFSFELHSQHGNIHLFGETFLAKNVVFTKSENDRKLLINGVFEKKTATGSIISLKLTPVSQDVDGRKIGGESYGPVRISLESDDPNDATKVSMLSKLQYGKSYDELTEEERQTFDKSQIVNLASDQIGKMLISPVISPIESTFRHWLGLDYFHLRTDWVENLARRSGISGIREEDDYYDQDQSQIEHYGLMGRDVLLDNLSLDMGKYITPNWYVNYAATVQKELTVEQKIDYGLEHQITFRYDLPWRLRFIYMYSFSPINEEYIQSLTLETYLNF